VRRKRGGSGLDLPPPAGMAAYNPNLLAAAFVSAGEPVCVLLVMSATGATPRKAGTKAVITSERVMVGSIGGGPVESDAVQAADRAARSGRPVWLDSTLDAGLSGASSVCGGAMSVLVDPTAVKDAEAYIAAADALVRRRPGVLLTRVRRGQPLETSVTWHSLPAISKRTWSAPPVDADAARQSLAAEAARLVEGRDADGTPVVVLVEPILPLARLFVAGAGHIGRFVATLSGYAAFHPIVVDRNAAPRDPDADPPIDVVRSDAAQVLANCDVDDHTYIVIATYSHETDLEALRACVRRPARYIGMIGSRHKVAMVREALIASGDATAEEFDRVHAPIGLDIGAETPAEIATSIVAEMIAVRRGRQTG